MTNILFHIKQLFDKKNTSLTKESKIVLNVIYLIIGLEIWINLYRAQFEEYDKNWATILFAFGLSAITFTILTILGFKRKHWLQDNYTGTLIFLLTCSPITIGLVVFNYPSVFGQIDNG